MVNNKDVIRVGDDIMVNNVRFKSLYKGRFLKSGLDIRKDNSYRNKLNGELQSGKVIRIDGDKYLIGIDDCYKTYMENGKTKYQYDENNKPMEYEEKHPHYPSFDRGDGNWDVCEYGFWIDRDDFYKLSGFQHLNRLIGETQRKIDGYPSKIKKDKEWLKELEDKLEELEIVEKHLEGV